MTESEMIKKNLYHKGTNGEGILIFHGFTGNIEQLGIIYKYFKAKGYTVVRPILPGHSSFDKDSFVDFTCDQAIREAREWYVKLLERCDKVSLIGLSLGGNIATSIGAENNPKVKAVVAMEMPVLLKFKMTALMYTVAPFLSLCGIKFIKKNKMLWRAKYTKERNGNAEGIETFPFIPVKAIGEVNKMINKITRESLSKIEKPFLIINSQKSDLLKNDNARFTYDLIPHDKKGVLYVPIDNHDLNLMDDAGKMLMLEKVYKFINEA